MKIGNYKDIKKQIHHFSENFVPLDLGQFLRSHVMTQPYWKAPDHVQLSERS